MKMTDHIFYFMLNAMSTECMRYIINKRNKMVVANNKHVWNL